MKLMYYLYSNVKNVFFNKKIIKTLKIILNNFWYIHVLRDLRIEISKILITNIINSYKYKKIVKGGCVKIILLKNVIITRVASMDNSKNFCNNVTRTQKIFYSVFFHYVMSL